MTRGKKRCVPRAVGVSRGQQDESRKSRKKQGGGLRKTTRFKDLQKVPQVKKGGVEDRLQGKFK